MRKAFTVKVSPPGPAPWDELRVWDPGESDSETLPTYGLYATSYNHLIFLIATVHEPRANLRAARSR